MTVNSLPYELQQCGMGTQATSGLTAFHLASVEKMHIQKVLKHTNWNKAEAARLMDIGLATLYRKIEEYGIK